LKGLAIPLSRSHVASRFFQIAGRKHQSSAADILDYLIGNGKKTWRDFYDVVVKQFDRIDIQEDVLDNPVMQQGELF
jgi:hypothetical protein